MLCVFILDVRINDNACFLCKEIKVYKAVCVCVCVRGGGWGGYSYEL